MKAKRKANELCRDFNELPICSHWFFFSFLKSVTSLISGCNSILTLFISIASKVYILTQEQPGEFLYDCLEGSKGSGSGILSINAILNFSP